MEQMELPGFESNPLGIDVQLAVQVFLNNGYDATLTLQEAKSLHEQLDAYRHLWGNYNGR